jgi:predicted DsbA family dithiol-disulfide isomerase
MAEKLASGLIDGQRFATLMASTRVDGRLRQDIESAERIEIRATPTLFINGRRFVGNPGRGLMEKIVETEVQRRRIERFKNRINPLD